MRWGREKLITCSPVGYWGSPYNTFSYFGYYTMTNDDARQLFKDHLKYCDIFEGDILLLIMLINKELKLHRKIEKEMKLTLSLKYHYKKEKDGSLKELYLCCNGSYFKKREAISFESSKWIGFAGWASTKNTYPFISAFVTWVKLLIKN